MTLKGAKQREGATRNLVFTLAEIEGARPIDAIEQRERPVPIGPGDFLPFGPRGITQAAGQQGGREGLPTSRFHDFGRQLENSFPRKVFTAKNGDELSAVEIKNPRLVVRHVGIEREGRRI